MVFKTVEKYFGRVGFTKNQSLQSHPFNRKTLPIFLLMNFSVISHSLFLFNEVTNIAKLMESIYMTSATMTIAFIFMFVLFNMAKVFEHIELWRGVIKKSE